MKKNPLIWCAEVDKYNNYGHTNILSKTSGEKNPREKKKKYLLELQNDTNNEHKNVSPKIGGHFFYSARKMQ